MKKLFLLLYHFLRWVFITLFVFGVFLLLLNIASFVMPFRSPGIYNYYNDERKDVLYTYQETMAQINRLPGESDEEYIPRLANVLSGSISPSWYDDKIDDHYLRVPIWENYILWLYSYVKPRTYLRYEYSDYQIALERGVGLCSQYAIVAEQIMEQNGIEAKVLALYGHVLNMAKVDDHWYIVDPEFDVVIPFSLDEVEKERKIIEVYYQNTWAPNFMPDLFVSAEDNKVFESAADYKGYKTVQFEQWSYKAVWYIPFLFLAPFGMMQTTWFLFFRKVNKQGDITIQNSTNPIEQ